ncbi:MAG: TetR/AcrR family transcriptional regulator [Candidatus Zophobacter franzmannii]|nr:TetR/AcrR family transcriptional regulator [Candidatus Zophobacter franzmannii]
MKVDNTHTQEKVLKTAKTMMLEYGLKGVNMDKLAKESGVAKATLYKIIGSKEDLITKIAVDFFAETFGHIFETILNIENYDNYSKADIEEIASLAVGKMRVIHRQVFLEYPLIEQQVAIYMANYNKKIDDKFRTLQQSGQVTTEISPGNIFRFFKMLFMQMVISSQSDMEVKSQLVEMYYVFFRGLKA